MIGCRTSEINFNQCMNFHFWVIIETQTIFSSICNGLLLKILCFMALPLAYSFLPCKRSCRHEILDKKLSKWNWFEWVAGWRVREKESGLLISFSSISLFNGPELLYYYQICFRGLIWFWLLLLYKTMIKFEHSHCTSWPTLNERLFWIFFQLANFEYQTQTEVTIFFYIVKLCTLLNRYTPTRIGTKLIS